MAASNYNGINTNEIEENFLISMQNMLGCFAIYTAIRDNNNNIIDFLTEYVNDAACKFNQMTREEQVGRRLLELLTSHKENNIFQEYCKVIETGKPLFKEHLIYEDIINNQEFNKVLDIMVIKYKDGFAVTWRDVTETRNVEEALQESEERFKGAFENAAIGMSITGIDGKHIKVNSSLCEMTGYSENELLEMTFMEMTYPDDLDANLNLYKQALEGKIKYYHMEKRFIHKQGHIVWVCLSASLVRDAKNNPLYFTTQIQDITVIKQASEALEYDKLKTEFFANISHELRTPLNVILASIQLSELHMKINPTIGIEKLNKNISTVKQNCMRLLRLVNNLIDVTKIDAGFHELQLQPFNIIKLIKEITLSVAEYAKGKGISTQFDSDVQEKIMYIDPDKIERIMLNLLSNSIKFTESNGNIFVNIHGKEDKIIISVKDSGIGIPLDKQDIIFQRFRQVEQTLTRRHEGSGIGLSLVQSLVEMHGGKIHVNSEVGVGSEFIIELPVKPVVKDEYKQVNHNYSSNYVEKINVEFSDIYMLG